MGLRFRKSIKILPGLRVNLSKSGISTTVGGKGASLNIGNNQTYLNAGIPGTGLYMREKIESDAFFSNDPPLAKPYIEGTSFKTYVLFAFSLLLGGYVFEGYIFGGLYLASLFLLYRAYLRYQANTKPIYTEELQFVRDRRFKTGLRPAGMIPVISGFETMTDEEQSLSKRKGSIRLAVALLFVIAETWVKFF